MKPFCSIRLALFIVGLCSTLMSLTATAKPARVAGRVVNLTTKKGAGAATVQLLRFDSHSEKVIATTKANAVGRFDFGTLDFPPDDVLLARVVWAGYPYEVPAYDGAGKLKEKFGLTVQPAQVEVQVYDTTTTAPPLSFVVHHLALKMKESELQCIERIVVENPSQRVFIGGGEKKTTIQLELPKGARDVKMDPKIRDARLVQTGEGLAVVKAILPGRENRIILNYVMDWPRSLPWARRIELSRRILYPTKFFFVAREEADRKLQVTAPQLSADRNEQLPIEGDVETRIVNMIGRPMEGGEAALKKGTPLNIAVSQPVNPLFWIFLMFVVALCVFVPLALHGSRRGDDRGDEREDESDSETENWGTFKSLERASGASVSAGTSRSPVPGETSEKVGSDFAIPDATQDLIQKIARLDDDWEAGAIGAAEYQSQRTAWKAKLVELLSVQKSE